MILKIVPLLALSVSACGLWCPKPKPPKPITLEVERDACVQFPPPKPLLDPADVAGPEEGCPEEWEFCMTMEASGRLARYMADLQRWADQAWMGCASDEDLDNENEILYGDDYPDTGP